MWFKISLSQNNGSFFAPLWHAGRAVLREWSLVLHGTTNPPVEGSETNRKGLSPSSPTPKVKVSIAGQPQKTPRKKGNPSKGRNKGSTIVPPLPSLRPRTTPYPRGSSGKLIKFPSRPPPTSATSTTTPRRQEIIYPDMGGSLQFSPAVPNMTFNKPISSLTKSSFAYPSFTRPKERERPKGNKNRPENIFAAALRPVSGLPTKGLNLREDTQQKNSPGKGI